MQDTNPVQWDGHPLHRYDGAEASPPPSGVIHLGSEVSDFCIKCRARLAAGVVYTHHPEGSTCTA